MIRHVSTSSNTFRAFTVKGSVLAFFTVPNAGAVKATLKNLQGKTILSRSLNAKAGINTLEIQTSYHGMMILQIQQKDKKFISKVICE